MKRRDVALVAVGVWLLLAIFGDRTSADALVVEITPPGTLVFQEGSVQAGQILWSADQGLTIPPSNYDYSYTFTVTIAAGLDNIPVDPSVSPLLLGGFPEGFPETLTWRFVLLPYFSGIPPDDISSGPPYTWAWSASLVSNSPLTFAPGQVIATADWATSGADLDGVADDSSFTLRAALHVVARLPGDYLPLHVPYGTISLNPEPIPEPTSLIVLALGALGLLRRKRNRICFLT